MAEEVKNTVAADAVEQNAETKVEPKIAYSYTVVRKTDGLWDFTPLPMEGTTDDSIDKYHIALDIIELGNKLDKQLILEEAEARVMRRLDAMAKQQMPADDADPTQA